MLKRVAPIVYILVIYLLSFGGVAHAIGNPDYVTIGDAYVFRNVLETGDQLYFVRYDVSYNGTPDEDSEDTWQMALYDSNDNLTATRPLNYYQHNIISIYLTPDQALTWELAHYVRIMGNPAIFSPLTEGVNMTTRVLAPSDYYEASSLGGVMITQAEILEADWEITLLTTGDLLNSTGATYFIAAVPGLSSMVPEIFSATTRRIPWERTTINTTGINATEQNLPVSLEEGIEGVDTILGVTDHTIGGVAWVTLLGLVVGGGFYATTNRPDISILGGMVGTLGISAWLGVSAPQVMYTFIAIALVVVLMFTLVYVVPKMGG